MSMNTSGETTLRQIRFQPLVSTAALITPSSDSSTVSRPTYPRDGLAALLERLLDRAVDMITGVRKAFRAKIIQQSSVFGGKTEPEVHMIQPAQREKQHGKAHATGDEPEYNSGECQ